MRATVVSIAPSLTSAPLATVTIAFHNPEHVAREVRQYRLAWKGGALTVDVEGFQVPAGASRERTVRVTFADGDVRALVDAEASPTVVVEKVR